MNAHRVQATVDEAGGLHLSCLPFRRGAQVEVIILENETRATPSRERRFPFRGFPHEYIDPFEPACSLEDWDVYKE